MQLPPRVAAPVAKTLFWLFKTKCKNSFKADTLVATPNDLKPIAELEVGDYVMSRDEATGQVKAKKITHKFVEWHDNDVRELTVNSWNINEEIIITSDEHPFYVVGKGFVPAKALKPNDLVFNIDLKLLTVVSNKRIEQSMQMYNFEVEDFHTYAVSDERVWVHNACFVTPAGRNVTNHAFTDSLGRHGFKNLKQIDDIIDNPSKRVAEQSDGALVHVVRNGKGGKARFDFVVEGEEGIVTGLRNLKKRELDSLAYENGWTSPF